MGIRAINVLLNDRVLSVSIKQNEIKHKSGADACIWNDVPERTVAGS